MNKENQTKETEALIDKINNMRFAFKTEEKINFLLKDIYNRPKKTIMFYVAGIRYLNKAEEDNGREWVDFTPTMLEDALYDMDTTSLNSLCSIMTVIKDYLYETRIQTIEDKYAYHKTFTLTRDELKKYINKAGQELRYVTPSEFDDIILNQVGEAMGKSIFILLYHGVKGKSFKDIQELKNENINLTTGEIYNDNKELLAIIPNKYLHVLKEAMEEEFYTIYNKNGEIENQKLLIEQTGYFLRTVKWRSTRNKKPNRTLISRILEDYLKGVSNDYVDGQSIYNSGEVYRLLEYNNMKTLTDKDWREWKELTGSTLSYNTTFTVSNILLKKLGKYSECESNQ